MENTIVVYDIETLSNCFTYIDFDINRKKYNKFSIWGNINEIDKLVNYLNDVDGMIGYNNLDFDYPVLHYILNNYYDWTAENLSADNISKLIYAKAQEVINENWSSIKPKFVKIPQLDLFKIWHFNNRARMTSLKKLQVNMRYENVQDMPYKHTDTIRNEKQLNEILEYNENDVKSTYEFFLKSRGKIDLRKNIYKQYGLDCINYPDSKIGEDLTLLLYCEKTGEKIQKIKKLRTNRKVFKFIECFPHYMTFKTLEFKSLINYLSEIVVNEIKGSFKYSFTYEDFQFDLGTGGIHGCIKAGVYESDEQNMIIDVDVSSLYPSLAIVNNLYPKHLGEEFLDVYENGIVKPRLKAKKEGNKILSDGFKLSANSVYGKSNSEYSWLYDPLYTLKTTLAGQLSLCMLSEQVMIGVEGLKMLQINTDGISVMIPRDQYDNFIGLCKDWEKQTGLILEYIDYKRMIIRDVNNYIAETIEGKCKLKGTFVTYEEAIKNNDYHKSLSQNIVKTAIYQYFINNIPVEDTIMKSDNIYDFCKVFTHTKGWTCETVNIEEDNEYNIKKEQKTNRYFLSTDGKTFRKVQDNRIIEVEANKLVTIFNKYENKHILDFNIDYDYYINECYKIIHKIDGTEEKLKQEKKEKKLQEQRDKQEEKFIKYCVNKIPTKRQLELYGKEWLLEKYGTPKSR